MSLHAAARKLKSADAAERDQAMGELLKGRTRAVSPLIEVLDEPGAAVGRIALVLSALGAREAIDPLIGKAESSYLDSGDLAYVTRALAELLGEQDADNARRRRAIMRLSREHDPQVRGFAAAALGALGGKDDQERLHTLAASDTHAAVKKAALEALVKLKESGRLASANKASTAPAVATAPRAATAPSTGRDIEEGGLAIDLEALMSASAEAPAGAPADEPAEFKSLEDLVAEANAAGGHLQPYLNQLGAIRWADRNAAVDALVKAGKESVPHLIQALAHPAASVRMGACLALMRLQAPEAAYSLMTCATSPAVTDEERELRGIALKALANCLTGAEEGLAEPLVPLARDDDRWVRAGALLCLGRLADRIGIRVAVLALDDPDSIVRDAAAVAVSEGAREDDEDLVVPLLAILGGFPSPSAEVREAILIALSRIRVGDDAVKVRVRRRVRRSVLGQTSSMRRTAISVLEHAYADADPPPVSVIDDVLSRLDDDHPEVRIVAASFVSRHLEPGMTGAVGPLLDAITRHETTVGMLCLEALRRHDTSHALEALTQLSSGPDDDLASRARELLEGFAPKTELWAFEPEPEPAPEPDYDYAEGGYDEGGYDEGGYDEGASDGSAYDDGGHQELATEAVPVEAAEPPPDVVTPVMPDAPPAFVDNPSLRLSQRLMAVRDAGGAGRLSAADAQAARTAVLQAFAGESPAPALPSGTLAEQLRAIAALDAAERDDARRRVLLRFSQPG
jgi:HEAT repeat protein